MTCRVHLLPAGLLVAAAALVAGTVHAQAAPQPPLPPSAAAPAAVKLHLDYQRAPGALDCASAEQLAAAVEARLGRRVFVAASEADLHAQLRAQRVGRGYRIALQLYDRDRHPLGRRQLSTRARHCSALDEALALVVSLAADVTLPPPASAAPLQPPLAVTPLPLDTPIEVPADASAPRQPWQVRPSVGLLLLSGLLPGVGVAAAVEVELEPPRFWPFWLRASTFLEERAGAATGGEFTAHTLELGVCPWSPRGSRWESRLCAQQLLGVLKAQGFGSDADQEEPRISFALGLEQTLGYRIGDWFISVSGSLLATPQRRRYYYVDEDQITLHEQGWIWAGGRLALGFELRPDNFWR
jgi:hypothetical protein